VPLRPRTLLPAALLLLAVACSGGKDTPAGPTVGGLTLSVSGLPSGTGTTLSVAGPAGYATSVDSFPITLADLSPGSYSVSAAPVTVGSSSYTPTPASQSVQVAAGGTASAAVAYAVVPGSLALTVSGLPPGTGGDVSISGPSGFSAARTATATLTGLAPGTYTVAAAVVGTTTLYDPTPASQTVQVASGASAPATVSYSARPATSMNLSIHGFYVTQSVQTYDRTVPLVAGRDGLLRVFVVASLANTETPEVRARFYRAGALLQTITIPAPGASVPTDSFPPRCSSRGSTSSSTSTRPMSWRSRAMPTTAIRPAGRRSASTSARWRPLTSGSCRSSGPPTTPPAT